MHGKVACGLTLIVVLLHVGRATAQEGPPPAAVRVALIEMQDVTARRDIVGQLREVRRGVVAAEEEGRVISIAAEQGDVVLAGETRLAEMDDEFAQLDVRTAEAALLEAKAAVEERVANLESSKEDLSYFQKSSREGSAAARELTQARARFNADQAAIEAAKARVESAEVELERTKQRQARMAVYAPFDGVVVTKMTEVGEWLSRGDPVAEIISRVQIDAVIDTPEMLVNYLEVGEAVQLIVPSLGERPGSEVNGKVIAITPQADRNARTFPVKIRVSDMDGRLKPGMSVLAKLPTGGTKNLLTVPRSAVLRRAGGATIWVNADGKGMPVTVEVLFGVGDRYAVEPLGAMFPVQPGMQVVIEGAERLFPTQPLAVANAAELGSGGTAEKDAEVGASPADDADQASDAAEVGASEGR